MKISATLALATCLFFLPLKAQSPAPSLPGLPAGVREAMLQGDSEAALRELAALLAKEPAAKDTVLFLRAVSLAQAGQRVQALAALDAFDAGAPASIWVHKSKFLRAQLLRDERRFEEAAAIYAAMAVRLAGPQRQAELAEVYLGFAEELAAPPLSPSAKPDFARAADLFGRVLELNAPDSIRERAAWRRAQCIEAGNNGRATRDAYLAYLQGFDPGRNPRAVAGRPAWIFAARLTLARAQLELNDPAGARRTLEDLSGDLRQAAAGAGPLADSVRALDGAQLRELLTLDGEAQYALAATWRAEGQNSSLAIAALERFVERFADHPRALRARLELGEELAGAQRTEDALRVFDALMAATAPAQGAASDESLRIGARAMFLKAQTLAAAQRFEEARVVYTAYTAAHPAGADWNAAQQRILSCEFDQGWLHREREEFAQAKRVWSEYLARHPLVPEAAQTLFDIGELDAAHAAQEDLPPAQRKALWSAALATWRELESKYAGADPTWVGRARLRIGEVLEFELFDLEGAIAAYKSCEGTPAEAEAATALLRMSEPALEIRVERAALSGEALRAKVEVRNLEKLVVELWRLDLEAYFRKNLSHEDVENLDLDLIGAQKKFEVAVEGYAAHKPIEQWIDLGVDGPGAWVIAVSSEKLRASALCLRTDLDLIVKSTPDESYVFVQDMQRGVPAADVRVLAALSERAGSADPLLLEGRTDAQGFVRFALAPRSQQGVLGVLALRDGHCASQGLRFPVNPAQALAPRAAVYTDRTAYRPGDTLHWRAIVRGASEGRFVVQPGKRVEFSLADARGRIVRTQSLTQSEYGTLDGEFELPATSPLGTWRISLATDDNSIFNAEFTVAQFQLVHVELDVEFERAVYYRGETAVARIEARYSHGGPVADAPLSFEMPDGRTSEGRTDAQGRASVSFPTRELAEEQVLTLTATLTEEPLSARAGAWLALREFSLALSTARDVHAAGDAFSVQLHARSPDGVGVARKFQLSTLELDHRPGRPVAETRISEVEVTTGADGELSVPLRIERGGSFVIRARATDRFGNPVEAEVELEISGDEDETTLRLLADDDVLQAGGSAKLEVLEREKGGLALVTLEAGRLVEWRWMQLKPGKNPLEFPVADALAPRFVVSVAHHSRGNFRQAWLEFRVERELQLILKPREGVVAPGSPSAIDVELRDALGKPVQAQLSLAIVDEALFRQYPDPFSGLNRLFNEPPPSGPAELETSSSATFRYDGSTWEVSGEVLAEERRVMAETKWNEERKQAAGRGDEFYLGQGAPGAAALKEAAGLDDKLSEAPSREVYGGPSSPGAYRGPGDSSRVQADLASAAPALGLETPTAFWSATITTGADGKASVPFLAPRTSARWRVSGRAAATDPRAASASAEFVSRAPFFVELRTPAVLVEGDHPQLVARVHNTTEASITAELQLILRGAGVETTLPGGRHEIAPGAREIVFPELERGFEAGQLRLSLEAGATIGGKSVEARDAASVLVNPWGAAFSASRSGILASSTSFELALPAERKYTHVALELFVGASIDALLVDEALGLRRFVHWRAADDDVAALSAELFGAAEVLANLARSGRDSSSEFARVRERVRSLAMALVSAQDGAQGWRTRWENGERGAELNAWAMLALAAARDAGIPIEAACGAHGTKFLEQLQRNVQSDERKALIQHALARWNLGDWGALNRLHRMRAELSTAALAHTALALVAIERQPLAAELVAVIESRSVFDAAAPELGLCWDVEKNLPFSRSRLGSAALCVLALEAAAPRSAQLEAGITYLHAQRPWADPRSSGIALAALARHAGTTQPGNDRFEVTASIDGAAPQAIDVAKGGSLLLPLGEASAQKLRVALELKGRGAPHFQAILRGFSSDVRPGARAGQMPRELKVQAPVPLWRGKPVGTGFSSVRSGVEQWTNFVQHLPRGLSAQGYVSFQRDSMRANAREGDWLILEIPLPAGATPREGSLSGSFTSAQILADRIVAWIPPDSGSGSVSFQLQAAFPGRYRVGPAVLRSASDPSRMTLGKPGEFEILPAGSAIPDAYRATPDELLAQGLAAWQAGMNAQARDFLSRLMQGFQADLRDESADSALQQAAGALFFLALEQNDSREIVRWFEVLREKHPELVIPFDKILAVAGAYTAIDEHERALSILRASVEQTFGVDLKVAGALEAQGDVSAALHLLARLWSEYPDAPAVLETWLALSDKLLTLGPKAAENKSLVRDGRTRAQLHMEGTRLLQMFLCLFPQDPQAPEAALNLISAHLGLEDYATASRLAQLFATRFSKPEFADAFLYSRAVAEWYQGNDEQALRVCERVAAAVYPDANGVERPSKNRELAQYILAQIHHARREVARAAEYYAKVEQAFADAKAALGELRARTLALDEVTRVKPGEKVKLKLRSKNVAEVELAVHPVDLMTLYLREADLAQVARVDLAGIAPQQARTLALGQGNALRELEQELELELPKQGAYLVIARGGDLFASGLVLVSELELDVHEDVELGGVRVQVVDGRDGSYVRDVDVRVVGSADKRIQRAKSDLRGMLSLEGVNGAATVIARAGEDRYAFWRGTRQLGAGDPKQKSRGIQAKPAEQLTQEGYLSNVMELNAANQSQRAGRLIEEIGRQRLGVQINQVK